VKRGREGAGDREGEGGEIEGGVGERGKGREGRC